MKRISYVFIGCIFGIMLLALPVNALESSESNLKEAEEKSEDTLLNQDELTDDNTEETDAVILNDNLETTEEQEQTEVVEKKKGNVNNESELISDEQLKIELSPNKKEEKVTKKEEIVNEKKEIKVKRYRGIAVKPKTNVRESPSTKSKILTDYQIGTILSYQTYNKYWYEIKITLNGKEQKGYIHKSHLENAVSTHENLLGRALKSPTNIRTKASTKSNLLGSLSQGKIHEVNTFSTYWYEVTFTVDGKKVTGYIHKKHINIIDDNIQTGVAGKAKTYIRSKPSTKSTAVTIYSAGTYIEYTPYNKYWYKVFVKGSGIDKVGYIHKNHLDTIATNQKVISGMALKSPTNIRTKPSTKSKVLTKKKKGTIFEYKTYTANWYEVSVGKDVGFVHKKHVQNGVKESDEKTGVAKKNKTNIRSNPSTKSEILMHYSIGDIIKYKEFNDYWHKVTIKVKGKVKTGFIHKKHIGNPKVIFIDPGHGGKDSGAIGNNLKEKDLTLDIAKRIEKHLNKYNGVVVKLSRTDDTFYELTDRVKMANDINADYFISTHINSFDKESANGFESFIHSGKNGTAEAKNSQRIIHNHIAKNIDEVDRGMKEANFHVLRETNMPAILFEYMFITNKQNSNQLKKSAYRDKLARVTAEGIAKAFDLERK